MAAAEVIRTPTVAEVILTAVAAVAAALRCSPALVAVAEVTAMAEEAAAAEPRPHSSAAAAAAVVTVTAVAAALLRSSLAAAAATGTGVANNRLAPLAVAATKQSAVEGLALDLDAAFDNEARHSDRVFASEDAKEGPRAFVEKRPPVWRGR